jgi:hypothetical protein
VCMASFARRLTSLIPELSGALETVDA